MLKIAFAFIILIAFNLISSYIEHGGNPFTGFTAGFLVFSVALFVLLRPRKPAPKASEPVLPRHPRGRNITAW